MVKQIDLVKQEIISNSIKQDQAMILKQWERTFIQNRRDPGLEMMLLSIALLAKNQFKICTTKDGVEQPAPEGLMVLDYFSHASRVIIDFNKLNYTNKHRIVSQLRNFQTQFDPRSSTHAVRRIENQIVEDKGFMMGLKGGAIFTVDGVGNALGITEPARKIGLSGPSPKDFGINLAMGGEGNLNFAGEKITGASGNSGHLFAYFNVENELFMLGLEQTMPSATSKTITETLEAAINATKIYLHNLWYGTNHTSTSSLSSLESEEELSDGLHIDQFGQGHSLTGASDTYTAAGSLYFSDLIYKLKLYHTTGALTPIKYKGMIITLDDEGFESALNFVKDFNLIADRLHEENDEMILDELGLKFKDMLSTSPLETKSLTEEEKNANLLHLINEITEKDLSHYFTQLFTVFLPKKSNDNRFKMASNKILHQYITLLKDIKLWMNEGTLRDPLSLRKISKLTKESFNLIDDVEIEDIQGLINSITQLTTLFNDGLRLLENQAIDVIESKLCETNPTYQLTADVKLLLNEYKKHDPGMHNKKHKSIATKYDQLVRMLGGLQLQTNDEQTTEGSFIMADEHSAIVALANVVEAEQKLSSLVSQDIQSLMIIHLANELTQYKNPTPTFRSNQTHTLFAKSTVKQPNEDPTFDLIKQDGHLSRAINLNFPSPTKDCSRSSR